MPRLIPAVTLFALALGFALPARAALTVPDQPSVAGDEAPGAKTKKTKFPYV